MTVVRSRRRAPSAKHDVKSSVEIGSHINPVIPLNYKFNETFLEA